MSRFMRQTVPDRSLLSAISLGLSLFGACEPDYTGLLDADSGTPERSDDAGLPTRAGPGGCANHPAEFVPLSPFGGWSREELDSLLHCRSNSDCTDKPHGYCEITPDAQVPLSRCSYGCETDADCGDHAACDCGSDVGRCVFATCAGADDCGGGSCVRFEDPSVCTDGYLGAGVYYDCTGHDAKCERSSDCAAGEVCSAYEHARGSAGVRRCQKLELCGI
jgi:hypothetical protein